MLSQSILHESQKPLHFLLELVLISAALGLADHSLLPEILPSLGFRDAPPSWFCSQLPQFFHILCWICLSPFLVLKLCSPEGFVLCPIPHLNLLLCDLHFRGLSTLNDMLMTSQTYLQFLSLPCFVCFTSWLVCLTDISILTRPKPSSWFLF